MSALSLVDPVDLDQDHDEVDAGFEPAHRESLLEDALLLRSHARIAHLVAADCDGRFLHVAGLGWYRWDGRRFLADVEDKAVTRAVTRGIGRLAPEAIGDKELLADLVKSQTSSGLAGVVRLMSTIESLTAEVEELDADPWLLNTPTGVLDLRELEQGVAWRSLTVHPHDPSYRMTMITRGGYDPNARSDLWDRFLAMSLPDQGVRRDLQQMNGGLGLIGEQLEHILTILTGAGRNGKGVFYGGLMNALGDYACVASPALFNIDRNATADKPNPALLGLRACRLVFLSETAKAAELDSAKVKSLTGGDRIKARGVHSKITVEFDPAHQLSLITNHPPQLPADDPAVWERVRRIPWDVVVPPDERDPRLGSKLKEDADAILGWALQGLEDYLCHGLTLSTRVLESTEAYKSDLDTVANFLGERCEDGCADRDSEPTKIIHADYQKFCRANGVMREHILGERDFGARLDELGYPTKRSNGRRFRQGLRVLPSDDVGHSPAQVERYLAAAHGQPGGPVDYSPPADQTGPKEPGSSNDPYSLDPLQIAADIPGYRAELAERQAKDGDQESRDQAAATGDRESRAARHHVQDRPHDHHHDT